MKKYYEVRDSSLQALVTGKRIRYVKANEELNFTAHKGETVAIVGESGCGKSTFAKVLMGLETGYRWRDAPQWQGYFGIGRRDRNANRSPRCRWFFKIRSIR
jgi:ABC-type glutathione transport system ATPase component